MTKLPESPEYPKSAALARYCPDVAEAKIAFLGLGTMGAPMANNLERSGFSVARWNRTAQLDHALADSPQAAAESADIIITMLTGGDAVEEVLFGQRGAATGNVSGKLFVDMSTSGPRSAHRVAEELRARGARFVDAPVSGTRGPAERGELVVLAGRSSADLAALEGVFGVLGRRVIHAGPAGAGQTLKIVLNGMGCQHLMAFTSMLRLGQAAGLARGVVVDAFTNGAFATPAYVGKRERVLREDYDGADYPLELVLRDADLCQELQHDVGLAIPTHGVARSEVEKAVRAGLGEKDLFVVEQLYTPSATRKRGAS